VPAPAKLLFVCGFPGGGTDLVKTVLSAHPDVYLNGEMPFLPELASRGFGPAATLDTSAAIEELRALLRRLDVFHSLENLDADLDATLRSQGRLGLDQALRRFFTAREVQVWGNKTPQYTEAMPRLAQLFPTARFLVVVRDVRDVCLSWRRKWGRDVLGCAARWAVRMTAGLAAARELPAERSLWIRFEELLASTEATCRRACDFLGLTFSPAMLEHDRHLKGGPIDGKINYGRSIQSANQGKWRDRLDTATVRRIEEVAFDAMQAFDYPVAYAKASRPITRLEGARAWAHDALAMAWVGNRTAESNDLRQRWRSVRRELRKRVTNLHR
jgi:hypothetical protein